MRVLANHYSDGPALLRTYIWGTRARAVKIWGRSAGGRRSNGDLVHDRRVGPLEQDFRNGDNITGHGPIAPKLGGWPWHACRYAEKKEAVVWRRFDFGYNRQNFCRAICGPPRAAAAPAGPLTTLKFQGPQPGNSLGGQQRPPAATGHPRVGSVVHPLRAPPTGRPPCALG